MSNRLNQILNSIKKVIISKASDDKINSGIYKYECLRCGLTIEYNRLKSDYRCPIDGSTLYRIFE